MAGAGSPAKGKQAEPAPAAVSSGFSTVIAANAREIVALTAAARAVAVGEALARADWLDRAAAIEARSLSAAVFDDALARAGRAGFDLRAALSAMKGLAVELITAQAAAIAPLITVAAPRRLPALWWAHRLYNDPQRAVDLARRTRSPNPAALPDRFEALAS
jgi:prophage DNA circulation protein